MRSAQANINSNSAGSLIQFDPTAFGASNPKTIVLAGTLTLSETAGPEVIDGPGGERPDHLGQPCRPGLQGRQHRDDGHALRPDDLGRLDRHNGGGIDDEGTLTLTNCTIAGNSASGGGNGGGIYNNGPLTGMGCTLSGNSVTGGYGGGIANDDTMSLTNSTVAGNSDTGGSGGGIDNETSLTITDCSIIDNTASRTRGRRRYLQHEHADGHRQHPRRQLGTPRRRPLQRWAGDRHRQYPRRQLGDAGGGLFNDGSR